MKFVFEWSPDSIPLSHLAQLKQAYSYIEHSSFLLLYWTL